MTTTEINSDPVSAALMRLGWLLLVGLIGSSSVLVGAGIWVGRTTAGLEVKVAALEQAASVPSARIEGQETRIRLIEIGIASLQSSTDNIASDLAEFRSDFKAALSDPRVKTR